MSKSLNSESHIGSYIKSTVIPKEMTVKAAAELLGVGRPALSNLLNGKASLSPDMAARLERAFGASANMLMDMQAAIKTRIAKEKGITSSTRSYIPPFLKFKAIDIENWASTIKARTQFAVFLRTLINSTGFEINKIDFPGNDDAERPGWDGYLETKEGTPWVPAGISGWEFGVNKDPKQKADKDYKKSVEQNDSSSRLKMTFVFVTPMRWVGKEKWRKEKQEEKKWKEVLVFDASDIEQWLEQSIPGQAWFAGEVGIPSQGVISLDKCWEQWVADTEPPLSSKLFDTFNEKSKTITLNKLSKSEPLIITSDSTDEALAFISSLFSPEDPDLMLYRDRIAVFTEQGALSKLVGKPSDFIAVITTQEIEREFAPYKKDLRSIIIYPRNITNTQADIVLEPINHDAFSKGLESMGYKRDQINRLSYESGRSLTVLRRRLSGLDAIRTPEWATNNEISKTLLCFLFAGVWEVNNESDKVILSLLGGDKEYEELEKQFMDLLLLTNSPAWSIGHTRGLISKIDTLYSINKRIVWSDIERFLNIAQIVLSEDDPALDLPEQERWAASIYGKTREVSSTLRKGIGETLVLLAVYGNSLFQERMGVDIQYRINELVKSLLSPLTTRKLEAQSGDLPLYSEAAPEILLEILEKDLNSEMSQSIGLMRPVNAGVFGRNPRTGLLWALESLAWSSKYFMRVVLILSKLAKPEINDNWVNKPIGSLSSIFRCWMPQTNASLKLRIDGLEYLVREYPEIAWSLCIEQFNRSSTIGTYNYKPRWRTEAHGSGEPVGGKERLDFAMKALEFAMNWNEHTSITLGDLVACVREVPEEAQNRIWDLIEQWSVNATDSEKSILREKVRTSFYTRQAKSKEKGSELKKRAQIAYELLEPIDTVCRHEWLFKDQWIKESYNELEDEDLDFKKRDMKIESLRGSAIAEIMSERGIEGILDLADRGRCAPVIGQFLYKMLSDKYEVLNLVESILTRDSVEKPNTIQSIISGVLREVVIDKNVEVLQLLIKQRDANEVVPFLLLAPFVKEIWEIVEQLGDSGQDKYWKEIMPNSIGHIESDGLQYVIEHLMKVNRPRAAFNYVQYEFNIIPPKLLFRLMSSISNSSQETKGTYMLDSYNIINAINLLTESGEIPLDQMAGLEFQFIEAFDRENHKISNLEKYIEEHPEIFVQALSIVFNRSDGREDPIELRKLNEQITEGGAGLWFSLLEKLSFIPGHDSEGELEPDRIVTWIQKVRKSAVELSREKVCDEYIGKLFSKAPIGEDDIWPCKPVRKALERIINENISLGLRIGLYNSHGVHWREEGGNDERKLADRYERWARELESNYPRLAGTLDQMSDSYLADAVREDHRAGITRRLLN